MPGSILPTMGDLFADAAHTREHETAPLPQRVRPRTLDQLVGQRHVLGAGSALRLAIEGDRVTLDDPLRPTRRREDDARADRRRVARAPRSRRCRPFRLASTTSAACCSGRVTAWARTAPRTILFIDEIHRFNKAQQDALLHARRGRAASRSSARRRRTRTSRSTRPCSPAAPSSSWSRSRTRRSQL